MQFRVILKVYQNEGGFLTFPWPVEIVGHEIEKVDVILHRNRIEAFEIRKIGWPEVIR
jgi:hypothetical protein